MCGIIGRVGSGNDSSKIVLNGLKRLEYRGYDSWGIAVNSSNISVTKSVGEIENVESLDLPESCLAIGHTRWATHGKVNKANAHPHFSKSKNIALVHNGIVENYQKLKKFLINEGFEFSSDTDTEVIPNLIEYHLRDKELFEAVCAALKELEGNYAILLLHKDSDKLIAARRGSPLVLGIGNSQNFVASDIPAFLDHTRKVVYLYDKDVVEIGFDSFNIYNLESENFVKRTIDNIEWDAEQAKRGEFKHFMLKEISEQAITVQSAARQNKVLFEKAADMLKSSKNIFMVACGSSYHASLCAKYNFANISKLDPQVVLASELPYFKDFITSETAIIAVSQSGETADILDAVKTAKSKGAKILAVTNVMGSSLMREADHTLLLNAGPEIGVLSTKTYTAQLVVLNLLAHTLVNGFEEGQKVVKELVRYIYYLTSARARERIQRLSEQLRHAKSMFLIGRGMQYPTALEAALKIKEVSYIHAEGFAGGELKHGTIALIEHGTPCIVFASKENGKKILSNASELKSRGGYIIGIAEENNDIFDFFIKVIDAGELNSICQIIPIQILSYQLALLRGKNPDKPRNLAKSVTVK